MTKNSKIRIPLTRKQTLYWAGRYPKSNFKKDEELVEQMKSVAKRKTKYLNRRELIKLAEWKRPGGALRTLCGQNTDKEIEEITRVAFASKPDWLRIWALQALRGVSWAMASVILHFVFPNRYPILDVRVMNVVGGSTNYNFGEWEEFTERCRAAAKKRSVSMRDLDRALWSYDKFSP